MKFSIITPAYDIAKWLPQTIESVFSQAGNFSIEYILVLNDSPDNTCEVAKEYKRKLDSGEYAIHCKSISMQIIEAGKPEGMYVAINQGFANATGDVYAWIAGDDIYRPGAFQTMYEAFSQHPEIAWLKGITSTIGEHGELIGNNTCSVYHQDWLRLGVYGAEAYHVEQDSNFWRAEVWEKVGSFPSYFKSAGDYWLWIHMAKYARLWSINAPISAFRKRAGQDSRANHNRLLAQKKAARPKRPLLAWVPRLFFWPYFNIPVLQPLLKKLYPYIFFYRSRDYLEKEGGVWVIKTMPSFSL
ncbi:MAG: glycosyltransferase [Candidatus Adlerbacteria bacterium]